jgi:hypothetical protein
MPARSKAQQHLMGAAEHGANFPMARKLRASMTHQQLHDYASGPEKGKPEHVTKPMHPKMVQRARMVKESHAHLSKTVPGFNQMRKSQRMTAVQNHVNARLGRVR